MATEITETERKYDAPQGAAVPDLADLPQVAAESDPEEQTLRAEYYDTDDLRRIRKGIALRRRTGGNDAGWHLKLPLGGDSRSEIRLPPGRASRQVPAELAQLVLAFTRGRPLRPVAQISTVRQRRLLLDDAGGSLAEVVADDVSARALGDGAAESRWHEVEVELPGGGPRLLEAAARRLRRSGLRPAGRQAKLERALADRLSPAGLSPDQPQAGRRRPADGRSGPASRSPAADVVMAYARAQVRTLLSFDPLVRRDAPGAVPQTARAPPRPPRVLRALGRALPRGQIGGGEGARQGGRQAGRPQGRKARPLLGRGREPGVRQAGPPVRQAGAEGPVGARRPPRRRGRPRRHQGTRRRSAPGRGERVQLRRPVRAGRLPRPRPRGAGPARLEAGIPPEVQCLARPALTTAGEFSPRARPRRRRPRLTLPPGWQGSRPTTRWPWLHRRAGCRRR